ncbi:2592_t:CDS:2 [Cetraspora pellucida]|uniref:2592_t:CDS:1 n=1 Tax=Cetraspora pellucida TaxID=1433469 RepID=A0A9N9GHH8_9GLOM|nr:2592_t:CDS:2 [Cetraspora pellucida]
MVSHVTLFVEIVSVKTNHLCSYGLANYKLSKDLFQSIKFKYFFPTDQPITTFESGDIVFISGKYIIENTEPYFTIAYSTVINDAKPDHVSEITNLPICIPYYIYSVTINHEPKKVNEFIHFGAEAIEYNSVTTKPDIKMDIIIVYPLQSPKFKYLGPLGSNLKLRANYFVSGSSLVTPHAPSIIDLIDDDLNSANSQVPEESTKHLKTFDMICDNKKIAESDNDEVNNQIMESDNDEDGKKITELDNDKDLQDEFEGIKNTNLKEEKEISLDLKMTKRRKLKNKHSLIINLTLKI